MLTAVLGVSNSFADNDLDEQLVFLGQKMTKEMVTNLTLNVSGLSLEL